MHEPLSTHDRQHVEFVVVVDIDVVDVVDDDVAAVAAGVDEVDEHADGDCVRDVDAGWRVVAVETFAEVVSEVAEYAQLQGTSDAGSTHSPPV